LAARDFLGANQPTCSKVFKYPAYLARYMAYVNETAIEIAADGNPRVTRLGVGQQVILTCRGDGKTTNLATRLGCGGCGVSLGRGTGLPKDDALRTASLPPPPPQIGYHGVTGFLHDERHTPHTLTRERENVHLAGRTSRAASPHPCLMKPDS
jgi:hypothetical protein